MPGSNLSLRDISDVAIDINTVADESVVTFDSADKKFKARPLADSDIPAAIARDAEVTAAIAAAVGYSAYVALMTQAETDDPVATVLKNGLSGAIAWARTGVGVYTGTLTGAFSANKTALLATPTGGDLAAGASLERTSADVVTLRTLNAAGAAMDDGLRGTAIEILVYP